MSLYTNLNIDFGSSQNWLATPHVGYSIKTREHSAEVFAKVRSVDYESVLENIKILITSTLSDCAAVNHCISKEIANYAGQDVLDLNCNTHTIDSLAIVFRRLAKYFENEHVIYHLLIH